VNAEERAKVVNAAGYKIRKVLNFLVFAATIFGTKEQHVPKKCIYC